MATLYVTEFASFLNDVTGGPNLPKCPSLVDQTVAIGGSSTQSAAFSASTRVIMVVSDSICSIKIGGTNPVATTTAHRMPANGIPEIYAVNPLDKLAVITNT